MADLAITLQLTPMNPVLGDLELDATGSNILLTDDPSFPPTRATMQDIFICLRMFFGEWFLDPTQGVPYFRYVFVNNPDLQQIETIFRKVIAGRPGVASVDTFSLVFDRPNRTLYPSFAGRLTSGIKFTSSDFGPFIINL